jgi:hypothetical protein
MRTLQGSLALLLGMLAGSPLLADDVYLKNGRSFTDVVADVGASQVRIQLPGGTISLPRGAVDRVEKSSSSFTEYLARKEELQRQDAAAHGERHAAAWLDLARWARSNSLSQGAREAGLEAAVIDPRQPGLAAVLRPFGYVYEERLDRWISYDDSMRLHGFVQEGGQWVSREEHAEHLQDQQQQQAALAAQQAQQAAADARDALYAAQAGALAGGYGAGGGGGDAGGIVGGYYGGIGVPFGGGVFGTGVRPIRPAFHGEHRTFHLRGPGSPRMGSRSIRSFAAPRGPGALHR